MKKLCAAVLVAASMAACTTTQQPPPAGSMYSVPRGDAGTLAPCTTANDCASYICEAPVVDAGGYCSKACSGDADCPAPALCDSGKCKLPCGDHSACQGECGCPAGLVCAIGRGCAAPADVGMPCAQDSECNSQNCGKRAGVCDIAIGSPCNSSNCEICETWTNGKSYCSRECTADTDCNGYGGVCNGFPGSPGFCNPECTSQFDTATCAPSRCSGIVESDGTTTRWYCACDNGAVTSDCSLTIQKGAFGSTCQSGGECQSGDCVDLSTDLNLDSAGICTLPCSTDADCPSAAVCVACGSGADAGCGNRCFPTCDANTPCAAGTCRPGTSTRGASVSFCDPHQSLGDSCTADADCASGRCSRGFATGQSPTCIPSAGLPTGTQCTSDQSDCASGACCNSRCC